MNEFHTNGFGRGAVSIETATDEWLNEFSARGLRVVVVGYTFDHQGVLWITVRTWKPTQRDLLDEWLTNEDEEAAPAGEKVITRD